MAAWAKFKAVVVSGVLLCFTVVCFVGNYRLSYRLSYSLARELASS